MQGKKADPDSSKGRGPKAGSKKNLGNAQKDGAGDGQFHQGSVMEMKEGQEQDGPSSSF